MRTVFHVMIGMALVGCAGTNEPTSKTVSIDEWEPSSDILGIVVTPDEVIVPVGSAVQLEALGLNQERQTVDLTDAVEWASESPSVATVSNELSEEGQLYGMQAGTATIYADFDGVQSAPARITVTEADLVRLSVTPGSVTVGVGDTLQLSAEASFSDGSSSTANGQVRWITGDGSVAVLTGDGMLTGQGLGVTQVHAEWKGVQSDPINVQIVEEVAQVDADLVINAVYGGIDDGTLEIIIDLQNLGSDPVGGFWVDVFLDPETTPEPGDFPDAYHMVDYVGAQSSTTVTFMAATPRDRHDFTVLVDSLNAIGETDETNNRATGNTDGDVGPGGSGDPVALANLAFEYAGGFSTETETEYWIDVVNEGTVPAAPFYIDLFFDRMPTEEPEGDEDGDMWKFVPGLGAGETSYQTMVVDSACFECGSWLLIDGYDLVEESNESDNTAYVVLDGSFGPPAPPE